MACATALKSCAYCCSFAAKSSCMTAFQLVKAFSMRGHKGMISSSQEMILTMSLSNSSGLEVAVRLRPAIVGVGRKTMVPPLKRAPACSPSYICLLMLTKASTSMPKLFAITRGVSSSSAKYSPFFLGNLRNGSGICMMTERLVGSEASCAACCGVATVACCAAPAAFNAPKCAVLCGAA